MAETIQIGIQVDSAPIVALKQKLDEVKKSLQNTTDPTEIKNFIDEVKNLTSIYNDLQKIVDDTNDLIKDTGDAANYAAGSIGELEAKQAALTEQFKSVAIGSEEYRKLQQELIQTNTQLRNIELSNEALDNEQLAGELKSVAGGFGDIAGGLQYIGVSSGSVEEIAQTIAKVEGITKLATGAIEAYSSGMKVINALSARGATLQSVLATITGTKTAAEVADTAALGAQTAATEGATIASNALNVSLLANPIFLLIAAIGAIVGALILFSSETEVAEDQNKKLNATLENQQGILDRSNEKLVRNAQNRIDILKASGADAEQVYKAEINLIDEQEKARKKTIAFEKNALAEKKRVYKQALEEENEELAKSIADEIKQHRNKYLELKNQDGQYRVDKKIKTLEFNRSQAQAEADATQKENEDAEKKRKEDAAKYKASQEKKAAAQKEYDQNRLDAQRTQQDLENNLLKDGQDKDLKIQQTKYERLLEDTKKNDKLLGEAIKDADGKIIGYTGEKGEKLRVIEEQNKIDIQKINDKYTNEELKKQQEYNKLVREINQTEVEAAQQKIQDDADAKIQKLKDNATEEIKLTQEFQDQIKAITDKVTADKIDVEVKANAKIAEEQKKTQDEINKAKIDALQKNIDEGGGLKAQKALLDEQMNQELSVVGLTEEEKDKIREKYRKKNKEAELQAVSETAGYAMQGLNSIQGLSDSIFAAKMSKLEKGSAAEEKVAKKQFEINKKIQIAQAVIQGVQAVLAAYSSGSAIPVVGAVTGPLFAGLAAVSVAANIAKIKNSKFESSNASADTGTSGSGAVQSATSNMNLFGNSTNFNNGTGQQSAETNQTQTINVNVGVDEITSTQQNVQQITQAGKL